MGYANRPKIMVYQRILHQILESPARCARAAGLPHWVVKQKGSKGEHQCPNHQPSKGYLGPVRVEIGVVEPRESSRVESWQVRRWERLGLIGTEPLQRPIDSTLQRVNPTVPAYPRRFETRLDASMPVVHPRPLQEPPRLPHQASQHLQATSTIPRNPWAASN